MEDVISRRDVKSASFPVTLSPLILMKFEDFRNRSIIGSFRLDVNEDM